MKNVVPLVLCLLAMLGGALLCAVRLALLQPMEEEAVLAEPQVTAEPQKAAWDEEPQEFFEFHEPAKTLEQPAVKGTGTKEARRKPAKKPKPVKKPDLSGYQVQAQSADKRQMLPKDRSLSARDLNRQPKPGMQKDPGARFRPADDGLQLRIDIP